MRFSKLCLSDLLIVIILAISTQSFADNSKSTPTLLADQDYQLKCPRWKKSCHGTITFRDSAVYIGSISFGKPHGKGKMTWTDGSIYTGEFRRGMREGYGDYIFEDGTIYQGEWKKDKMNGKGTYIWSCGHEYIGTFNENTMNGEGSILFASGESYTGTWKNGETNGYGIYVRLDGSEFRGWTITGKKQGDGMVIWMTGDTLSGTWSEGYMTGIGTFKFKNGDELITDWSDGQLLSSKYITEDQLEIEHDFDKIELNNLTNELKKENMQLAMYAIALEFQNEYRYDIAKNYFVKAEQIKSKNDLLISYYLDTIDKIESEINMANKNNK